MDKFPERLREVRKRVNMSQADLAKHLCVAKSTVSGYERGVSMPDIYTLSKIAGILNVSIDYLLGREVPNYRGLRNGKSKKYILTNKYRKKDDYDYKTVNWGLMTEMIKNIRETERYLEK